MIIFMSSISEKMKSDAEVFNEKVRLVNCLFEQSKKHSDEINLAAKQQEKDINQLPGIKAIVDRLTIIKSEAVSEVADQTARLEAVSKINLPARAKLKAKV